MIIKPVVEATGHILVTSDQDEALWVDIHIGIYTTIAKSLNFAAKFVSMRPVTATKRNVSALPDTFF